MSNNIHPTAIVHKSANIGKNVSIGPYTIIHNNVKIGDNTKIRSHCVLYSYSEIGNNNTIYDHAIIGSDPQDLKFDTNIDTYVKVLDNNIIREYVSIHRATKEDKPTKIFNNIMIMANSHVGHDSIVGNNVIISNASLLGGNVIIEDYAVLGGNTLVHQHVRVGKLSMIPGGARVTKDVIPYMLVGRSPVKHYCLNKIGIKRYGINDENYEVLSRAFRLLKKGEDIKNIKPMTEDLQYLISWFSVKSERGCYSFI